MKTNLSPASPPAATKAVRLPKTWPHVIRNGDVAVKIYKNKGHVRGENFQTFLVSYYASGKRQLRRFVDFAKASAAATKVAEQKAQGEFYGLKNQKTKQATAARTKENMIRQS